MQLSIIQQSVFSIACTLFRCPCLVEVPGRSYKIRLQAVLVKCLLKLIYQSKKNGYKALVATEASPTFPFFLFVAFKMKTNCYLSLGQKNLLFSVTLSKHSHYQQINALKVREGGKEEEKQPMGSEGWWERLLPRECPLSRFNTSAVAIACMGLNACPHRLHRGYR